MILQQNVLVRKKRDNKSADILISKINNYSIASVFIRAGNDKKYVIQVLRRPHNRQRRRLQSKDKLFH